MANDPLLEQVKAWGHATATRYAANEDGLSVGYNVLASQRDLGNRFKKKKEAEHKPLGRCGEDRRRFMAAKITEEAAGTRGALRLAMVPMWAVDPIPSRNDAGRPCDLPRAAVDLGVPDELRWIDRAYSQLKRQHPLRALCFYEEFCTPGTQDAKAARVEKAYGGKFSKWQYRAELQRALDWIDSKRAA